MKRLCLTLGPLSLLNGIGLGVAILIRAGTANADLCARNSSTDVCPGDWAGVWNCNFDGRSGSVVMEYVPNTTCTGDICTSSGYTVTGRFNDGRTMKRRSLDAGDPATRRTDHLLSWIDSSNNKGLFMMHTWNRNYFSGYGYWAGIPFGVQCQKER